MAADLFYLPFRPAIDPNGLTVPGAKLFFYLTDTLVPRPVFADAALTTPLQHPVEANAAGVWPMIYLDSSVVYRVILQDGEGINLSEVDPYIPGVTDATTTLIQQLAAQVTSDVAAATAQAELAGAYATALVTYTFGYIGIDDPLPPEGVEDGDGYVYTQGGRVFGAVNDGGAGDVKFEIMTSGTPIAFTQSGTGAVSRTAQNKLRDTVSVADFADLAAAMEQSANRMVFGPNLMRQRQTGAANDLTNLITRSATYTGGTPGNVTSAMRIETTVGAGNANYEWGLVSIMDNSATGTGENVAIYAQGNKRATGPTWALVAEATDYTNTANPIAGLIGAEVNIGAAGGDSNNRRIGVDIVGRREPTGGARPSFYCGLRLTSFHQDNTQSLFINGILIDGPTTTAVKITATELVHAIDVSGAAMSGSFVRLARAQKICALEPTGTYDLQTLGAADSVVRFRSSGTEKIGFDLDTPGLRMNGTKVVGAQGAAVADATDAASVITQLNTLLSRLRTHGLIGA